MQLIRKLKDNRDSGVYPFHMPGHKRRLANEELLRQIYGIDVTEIQGFDNLHDAKGIIKEAENRAAECFDADETHFLVNGSTGGILAAICGTVTFGDSIVIAANCHRSVYNAVMLSGAKPFVISPESESYFDISGGISAADVEIALASLDDSKHTAVVITSPTYEGIASDIEAIADVCHKNDSVLIVDAAHGAHFGFSDYFPKSAIASGADIVVTSVHKTLPAMTQTALIHISKTCPSADRIRKMLQVFMTSSPSYVLMASIDSMTDLLTKNGQKLFGDYVSRLEDLYNSLESLECLSILTEKKLTAAGSIAFDKGKIVLSDMTGQYSGRKLYDRMYDLYGICPELATDSYIILMTSIADTEEGFERLKKAILETDEIIANGRKDPKKRGIIRKIYDSVVGRHIAKHIAENAGKETPARSHAAGMYLGSDIKQAMFEDNTEHIPVELSEGRISAGFVAIYPPGIPVAVPGQKISAEAVDRLLGAKKEDLEITGLDNGEISVLWERSSTL